jgi:transportin-1
MYRFCVTLSLTRHVQSAYSALAQICEDIPDKLEKMTVQGQRPLDFIIPKVINAMQAPIVKIRLLSLNILKPFIVPLPEDARTAPPQALAPHMPVFVSHLFKLASDPNPSIRKRVCETMVQLLSNRSDVLLAEIGNVIDYMLHCTQDEDPELAVEACEFWLTFAELPDNNMAGVLHSHLNRIAPVLLDSMVYGDIEISQLGGDDEDDTAQPDRDQDIKPRTHGGAKGHGHERVTDTELGDASEASNAQRSRSVAGGADVDEDDDDDYDDDDDDDDLDDDTTEWTLRKCAAAALDIIATEFENELLAILLPHLKDKLWSQDWVQRESGILALGAIAEGGLLCLSA